jgi:hypothetical protein
MATAASDFSADISAPAAHHPPEMTKRRKVFLLLAGLALVMGAGGLLWHHFRKPIEPSYAGRSFSQWLDDYHLSFQPVEANIPTNPEPVVALRQIGTNAIPILLEWVEKRPTDWSGKFNNWAEALPSFLARTAPIRRLRQNANPYLRRYNTELAFSVLGTNANSAVPALARLLKTCGNNDTQASAALALAYIGPAGYEALLEAATNANAKGHSWAEAALVGVEPETLTNALSYPNLAVRCAASNALLKITAAARANAVRQPE